MGRVTNLEIRGFPLPPTTPSPTTTIIRGDIRIPVTRPWLINCAHWVDPTAHLPFTYHTVPTDRHDLVDALYDGCAITHMHYIQY